MSNAQINKYKYKKHKSIKWQSARRPTLCIFLKICYKDQNFVYFWKEDCSRISSESRTVVQGLVYFDGRGRHLVSRDRASEECGVWTVVASRSKLVWIVVAMSSPVTPMLRVLTNLPTNIKQSLEAFAPDGPWIGSWRVPDQCSWNTDQQLHPTHHHSAPSHILFIQNNYSSFKIISFNYWQILCHHSEIWGQGRYPDHGWCRETNAAGGSWSLFDMTVSIYTSGEPPTWILSKLPEYSLSRTLQTHRTCRHNAPDGNIHRSSLKNALSLQYELDCEHRFLLAFGLLWNSLTRLRQMSQRKGWPSSQIWMFFWKKSKRPWNPLCPFLEITLHFFPENS